MASTILQPIAELVATTIEALSVTPGLIAYATDPGPAGLDQLPAAVCGLPTVTRTDPDQAERQIGATDWEIQLPVVFLFDLADTTTAQSQAIQTVEAFIRAIDTGKLSVSDPMIVDAKVSQSDPGEVVDDARPMLTYDCSVRLLRLTV
jgi:hypothetical protein